MNRSNKEKARVMVKQLLEGGERADEKGTERERGTVEEREEVEKRTERKNEEERC